MSSSSRADSAMGIQRKGIWWEVGGEEEREGRNKRSSLWAYWGGQAPGSPVLLSGDGKGTDSNTS